METESYQGYNTQMTPPRAGAKRASEMIALEAIREGDNFKQKQ